MAEEEKRVEREVVVDREPREPGGSNTGLLVVLIVGVVLALVLLFGGFFDRGEDETPANGNDTTEIEADVNIDPSESENDSINDETEVREEEITE